MNRPSARRLKRYAGRVLGLRDYLAAPGDGRVRPQLPASSLLWAIIFCLLLRQCRLPPHPQR